MNIDSNKILIPISHCICINGAKRSIVLDLQRNKYHAIPTGLSKIIRKFKGKRISDIYDEFGVENKKILDDYLTFLLENEYIFLSDHETDIKRFLPLNHKYDTFSVITNAIVDLADSNFTYLNKIISELESLNCQHIQVRIIDPIPIATLRQLVINFEDTQIRNVDIILPYSNEVDNFEFEKFLLEFQRIGSVIFYNSPHDKINTYLFGLSTVEFVIYDYTNTELCGVVDPAFFAPNQPHYIESQIHNTCLNRKIYVAANGDIRNCPGLKKSFGNANSISLINAIAQPGFNELWCICKDKIDVCKDCEFRHVCTDCRVFIKDIENVYSQPAKCQYNPYIAKWQSEEGYVPVEKCGTYSKEQGFMVDRRKVNKLNKKIWGD